MIFSPELGRVCESRAGRDKGMYFMIVGIESDNTVFIADGGYRKLEKPKRKKVKHLALKPQKAKTIGQKLEEGKKVFDAEIKSALNNFQNEGQGEQKEEF